VLLSSKVVIVMSKRLFVGGIPYSVTEPQLQELFSQAGNVVSCRIITDRYSGRSKGFGFVEFENEKEAEEAVKLFNDYEMDGRKIAVNVARPMEERPAGNFQDRPRGGEFNRGRSDRRGGSGGRRGSR
jgi:RNA recognition motif-containing protein